MACAIIAVMVMSIIYVTSPVKAVKDPSWYNAYDDDINKCLFNSWPANVLAVDLKVPCPGSQLCYSVTEKNPAQFVVCYNTKTLIPDFTGHVVQPNIVKAKPDEPRDWHNEAGDLYAPKQQSSVIDHDTGANGDYEIIEQMDRYPNFGTNKQGKPDQFCSRGHLTPSSDFSTYEERTLTYINTNVAPQWQLFNGGNWAGVETAVKQYAKNVQRKLYVFTGTAGFGGLLNGNVIEVILNKRVKAPRYYWKVVCDPDAPQPIGAETLGQSVLIMADNNIGDISNVKIESDWKKTKKQTKKKGFVQLYSLEEAKKIFIISDFHLPPLGTGCNPQHKGTFLNTCLNKYLS